MSNHHAVVIDDKLANLEVMSVLLEKEAVSCTTIESPRLVLNTLSALARVDVVFLDLEFPNDDGFDIPEYAEKRHKTWGNSHRRLYRAYQ